MGIVRDWTTHCVALSNMRTTYNEQLERWARNNTGNKKGSIKITRRKIDILTTSRCRSFGRQGGKSGPRYKTRSQTQGAKDLSLIWDEEFGQIWDSLWIYEGGSKSWIDEQSHCFQAKCQAILFKIFEIVLSASFSRSGQSLHGSNLKQFLTKTHHFRCSIIYSNGGREVSECEQKVVWPDVLDKAERQISRRENFGK